MEASGSRQSEPAACSLQPVCRLRKKRAHFDGTLGRSGRSRSRATCNRDQMKPRAGDKLLSDPGSNTASIRKRSYRGEGIRHRAASRKQFDVGQIVTRRERAVDLDLQPPAYSLLRGVILDL